MCKTRKVTHVGCAWKMLGHKVLVVHSEKGTKVLFNGEEKVPKELEEKLQKEHPLWYNNV